MTFPWNDIARAVEENKLEEYLKQLPYYNKPEHQKIQKIFRWTYDELTLETLQLCCKLGIKMKTVTRLFDGVQLKLRGIDRLLQGKRIVCHGKTYTSSYVKSHLAELVTQQVELTKVLRYFLIHGSVARNTLMSAVMHAHREGNVRLLKLYKPYITFKDIDDIEKKYKSGSGLKQRYMDLALEPLRTFVRNEMRAGGKLDRLLYRPPSGLMIKRGMRECFGE